MTSCHQEDERKGRAKSCPPLDVDISTVEYRRYLFTELQTSLPLGIWPHHIASLMHEDDASITITNHFSTCQGCWILMHLYRWMFIDFHSEVLSTAVGSSLSRGDDEVGRREATSFSLVPTPPHIVHDKPTCRGRRGRRFDFVIYFFWRFFLRHYTYELPRISPDKREGLSDLPLCPFFDAADLMGKKANLANKKCRLTIRPPPLFHGSSFLSEYIIITMTKWNLFTLANPTTCCHYLESCNKVSLLSSLTLFQFIVVLFFWPCYVATFSSICSYNCLLSHHFVSPHFPFCIVIIL